MRMSHIAAAAGLFLASLGVATSADAQPYRGGDRWHQGDRHHDRGWDRGRGHGWGRGHGHGWRQHCWTEWHHHHRVRVCR